MGDLAAALKSFSAFPDGADGEGCLFNDWRDKSIHSETPCRTTDELDTEAQNMFDANDENGDGVICMDEYKSRLSSFYAWLRQCGRTGILRLHPHMIA